MPAPTQPHKFGSVLGPLEADIMEVVWAHGSADVRDVTDYLSRGAYTTVKTVMERLTIKGFLTRQREGKAYRYTPALSRAELEARVAQKASRDLLNGFGQAALTHFVEAAREDPGRLQELRQLLDTLADEEQKKG